MLSCIEGVHIGASALHVLNLIWFGYITILSPWGGGGKISSFKWCLPALAMSRGRGESAPCGQLFRIPLYYPLKAKIRPSAQAGFINKKMLFLDDLVMLYLSYILTVLQVWAWPASWLAWSPAQVSSPSPSGSSTWFSGLWPASSALFHATISQVNKAMVSYPTHPLSSGLCLASSAPFHATISEVNKHWSYTLFLRGLPLGFLVCDLLPGPSSMPPFHR